MDKELKKYFKEKFFVEIGSDVSKDTDLFKNGIINSYGYMEIIKFIEEEYGIEFTEEDMFSNILVSFTNIIEFVRKKKQYA